MAETAFPLLLAEVITWKEIAFLIGGAIFFYEQRRAAAKTAAISAEVKKIEATTAETAKETGVIKTTVANSDATVGNVYKLANHALGAALRLAAVAMRDVARMRPDSPEATKAAEEAERVADEHDQRQREVDADIAKRTKKIDEATTIVDKAKESPSPSYPDFATKPPKEEDAVDEGKDIGR